jgi:hypothetical protein
MITVPQEHPAQTEEVAPLGDGLPPEAWTSVSDEGDAPDEDLEHSSDLETSPGGDEFDDDWEDDDFDEEFDDDFEAELDEELERELAAKFAEEGFDEWDGESASGEMEDEELDPAAGDDPLECAEDDDLA